MLWLRDWPWQLEDNAARGAPSIEQTKKSPGTLVEEALRQLKMCAEEVIFHESSDS